MGKLEALLEPELMRPKEAGQLSSLIPRERSALLLCMGVGGLTHNQDCMVGEEALGVGLNNPGSGLTEVATLAVIH
jgi:hypothetical protein